MRVAARQLLSVVELLSVGELRDLAEVILADFYNWPNTAAGVLWRTIKSREVRAEFTNSSQRLCFGWVSNVLRHGCRGATSSSSSHQTKAPKSGKILVVAEKNSPAPLSAQQKTTKGGGREGELK